MDDHVPGTGSLATACRLLEAVVINQPTPAARAPAAGDDVAVNLLRDVAHTLAGKGSSAEILEGCTTAIVERLGAAFARIWTLTPAGDTLVLQASSGMYTHLDGAHARIPVGAFKIGRIAHRREPHLSNDVANDPEISDPEWARNNGMVSFAGYPLLIGDELLGVLGLFARHELDPSVLSLLQAVADAVALGIRRTTAEQELRIQAEIAETLYHAGVAIAQVHSLESVVQTVTDLATQLTRAQFGAFFYNALDERGEGYTLYTLSGAPREAFEDFPLPRNTEVFATTFHATAIERHDDITLDPRYGRNAPYYGMPEGHLPVHSYLAVPVVSRSGEVLGGLFFGHAEIGTFDERAERVAVGIAGHASAAIDAARMFELEHRLALNFQRTLLLGDTLKVPGVRLAQHYVPASEFAEVGGDWHDAIMLPDGTLALTIGDVVGHDLRAAVTMGRLRNAIQLYSLDGHSPVETLALAERYLQRAAVDDLATVLHARYDPATHELRAVRAGHPPPLVLRSDGSVEYVSGGAVDGAMLGAGVSERREFSVSLEPGALVVFFTDGLVERRGESLEEGMARLAESVRGAAAASGAAFCDVVVKEMLEGDAHDDIAILAVFVDE